MSVHLQAMKELAALRDALVVQLFAATLISLASVWMLQRAQLPGGVRVWLLRAQQALGLAVWIALLVVLTWWPQ